MKTFAIRVNTLKQYNEIATELIMAGYGDDQEWNEKRLDREFKCEEYKDRQFYVYIDQACFFYLFVEIPSTALVFDNVQEFLNYQK